MKPGWGEAKGMGGKASGGEKPKLGNLGDIPGGIQVAAGCWVGTETQVGS